MTWSNIKESQKELNGHVSMIIKIFKIGEAWDHTSRVRETTMGEGMSICPMSLLFKDHKGWSPTSGSAPPTRPVVGGHLGINMHISELVSDILDPVVACYEGGREIISTEDMVARSEILNETQKGWSPTSYWGDMIEEGYRSCVVCEGSEGYVWDDETPEICTCEEFDGVDDEGRILVTKRAMKSLRRARWEAMVGWDSEDQDRQFLARDMLEEDLHDQETPMVIIGTDVTSLYPSLDIGKVVGEVQKAVMNSEVKWSNIDYLEAARYVALNWTEAQCRASGLRRVLPRRRGATGTRPGLRGAGPQGGARGDQEQWEFPRVRLRKDEKKLLVATVVMLATQAMFQHHYYGFGGNKFQQMEGGPIGLRGTCTIARLVMQIFDQKWEGLVMNAGLNIKLYMRYMDDGRIFSQPIKRGWRWINNSLVYSIKWEREDMSRSLMEVSMDIMKESMRGVTNFLEFTYESGDDYPDGWLPTLDTSLWVSPTNQVWYKYYEKPTTTNTTLLRTTAMAENAKIQCLSNDLVRRLLNTKEELPVEYRAGVVDRYGCKLLTSGYSYAQTVKILANGAKGYLAKVRRAKAQGRSRLHRTSEESNQGRNRKKLLGKTAWYRDKKTEKGEQPDSKEEGGNSGSIYRGRGGSKLEHGTKKRRYEAVEPEGAKMKKLKTRGVVFVEQTPRGELACALREQLNNIEFTLGFKLRVVEKTGRSLLSCFPQTKTWGGAPCGRTECITCTQGGEELPDCTRGSIVYESICLECNPGATSKGELDKPKKGAPSLYVGESSRSIQERAKEHWGDAVKQDKKSHMVKHQALVNVGEPPRFLFKVVSSHRTALNRQIREAVRIRRRGGAGNILNSRAEYNRCHIPRLVVEEDDVESREKTENDEDEETLRALENMDKNWEGAKTRDRELREKKRLVVEPESGGRPRKRMRKMKYSIVGEDWGLGEEEQEDGVNSSTSVVALRPICTRPIYTGRIKV